MSTLSYAQEIDFLKKPIFSNSTELAVQFKKGIGYQLKIIPEDKGTKYKAISILKPSKGWDLSTTKEIEATFKNTGNSPVEIMFWVVGTKGWNAVGKTIQLKPGERKTSVCDLRATFPDGTHKLDPENIQELRILTVKAQKEVSFTLESIVGLGKTSKWKVPKERLLVPDMTLETPKAGKRVLYKLKNTEPSDLYAVLYLPKNWNPNKKYPVIVEFPGNIFYTEKCYSTGRPEQCVIGYGMTKGEDAIWLSMPFVNYKTQKIAESGWGNPEDTADYTVKMVKDVIQNFGADANNLVITGFSRGAIACGFIGLRTKEIASLWKGIHACQHYDGDGWGGAKMEDAIKRLKNFQGKSFFQTDNTKNEEPKKMLKNTNVKTTFVNSGLQAHACDMFLDDRPSTLKLRKWFQDLISE
ncbi:hypothetical protein [Flavicella sediminum]|uniref:hypothetical protein n=1 Tax=Flavicella sediminum TaxID=2585141 RepID=UPI0014091920|nr:hypothetical protein [Flavicella sediminum]